MKYAYESTRTTNSFRDRFFKVSLIFKHILSANISNLVIFTYKTHDKIEKVITKWCFIEYTIEDIIFLKTQLHIYRNAMIISDRDRKSHYTQLA